MFLPYCVYVLFSQKDSKFYIGFSINFNRRIVDHNSGRVISTKSRRPLKLVYSEFHINKMDALRRERYFKTTAGKRSLKLMIRESIKATPLKAPMKLTWK